MNKCGSSSQSSGGAVFRFLPLSSGTEAVTRLLLAAELGLKPSKQMCAALGCCQEDIADLLTKARDGKLKRILPNGVGDKERFHMPRKKSKSIVHQYPLIVEAGFRRAVVVAMLRPKGLKMAHLRCMLNEQGIKSPAASFTANLRIRLEHFGVSIASERCPGSSAVARYFITKETRPILKRIIANEWRKAGL